MSEPKFIQGRVTPGGKPAHVLTQLAQVLDQGNSVIFCSTDCVTIIFGQVEGPHHKTLADKRP